MRVVHPSQKTTLGASGRPEAASRTRAAWTDAGPRGPAIVLLGACRRVMAPRGPGSLVRRLGGWLAVATVLSGTALPVRLVGDSILPSAQAARPAQQPQNPDQPARPVPRGRTIGGDLVGTWNWVSGRSLVVFDDATFDLYQGSNLIGGGR